MSKIIEGLKLISHTGQPSQPDDPSYPFKLKVICRPPDFMIVAFVSLYGGIEELVVRGMTLNSINEFIELNSFKTHPRFISLEITGPDNLYEKVGR